MNEEKKIEGCWWVDGRNAPPTPGVLEISPSGLNLRISHPRNISAAQLFIGVARNQGGESVEIVYGQDEHNNPVTLFGCHQVGHNSTIGYLRRDISAIIGLSGWDLSDWEQPLIRAVSLKIEYFHRWLDYQPIRRSIEDGEEIGIIFNRSIDEVTVIEPGIRVRVVGQTAPSSGVDVTTYRSEGYVWFHFETPQSLSAVHPRWLGWCRSLWGCLFGTGVRILAAKVFDGDPYEPGEAIIGNCGTLLFWPEQVVSPRISNPYSNWMIAPYRELSGRLPDVLIAWHRLHESLSPVISLFSSVVLHHSLYDKAQFMFLVQALELYHTCSGHFVSTQLPRDERDARLNRAMAALPDDLRDWARGKLVQNNKSLREKLADVFQAHAAEATRIFGDITQAADRIAYTRNNLTHHMESVNEQRLLSEIEIIRAAWALEAFLWIVLLRKLGINGEPIQRLLRRVTSTEFVSLRS